ncbi:uncharacterized protein RJT21DRAFT_124736 [Scheffersomyces amazonensis]|uniref:uncharacterized protein n=1 Tax=Scheffersomyces amazonensis TaxID=1078765 RepID=UPI00315DE876
MSISTRVSLQWVPEDPQELSHTMAFTSPQQHYIDIRIYKVKYPYLSGDEGKEPFDKVFQWLLVGDREVIPNTSKVSFKNSIDSQAVTRSINTNTPLVIGTDIGDFSEIDGSSDSKEVGSMINPTTGKLQEYVEIWRLLDPIKNNPSEEVKQENVNLLVPVFTLKIQEIEGQSIIGKLVRLGNWIQGITFNSSTNTFNVIRSFYNGSEWNNQIEYGDKSIFPLTFTGTYGQIIKTSDPAIVWECIEVDNI